MAEIIDGRELAKQVNAQTSQRIKRLAQRGVQPGIADILVGNDPASRIYSRTKRRNAEKMGIKFMIAQFPENATEEELLKTIEQFNRDDTINAILVQAPLPDHLDQTHLINAIDPRKDVDGFHPVNVGKLYNKQAGNYPVACTPRGIMKMLEHYNVDLPGKNVVIVGRSILVGRPLQALMINATATVTIAGRHTQHLSDLTRSADILVVAAGHPQMIGAEDVKPGAVVIDVGINRNAKGKLVGDVDFDAVRPLARLITPVPGGVGPMTVASMLSQSVDLAEWKINGEE